MAHVRQPCLPCTSYTASTPITRQCRGLCSRPLGRCSTKAVWLVRSPIFEAPSRHPSVVASSAGSGDAAAVGPPFPAEVVASAAPLEPLEESLHAPQKTQVHKAREFANRVIFGLVLGVASAFVILYGRLAILALAIFVTYQASREYFGFMTSKQMSKGMGPPPRLVSAATTVMCISVTVFSHFYKGKSGTLLAVASFLLLVTQVVANKRPKFPQLASSVFGLLYCGWLPSFWLKLRSLGVPAPETTFTAFLNKLTGWPTTTGVVAVLTAVAVIIAADTGAYFVGKALGRTKLTDISPKKTVEGAAGGMAAAVAVALGAHALFAWPSTPFAAVTLGVMVFFSSLFGDLIESIMKRDAGMKDSGDLIPGHGGLLDRFDSYIFSGAVVYFFAVFVVPLINTMTGADAAAALAATVGRAVTAALR